MSQRNKVDRVVGKDNFGKLHPVEYSWKNNIISQHMREMFTKAIDSLSEGYEYFQSLDPEILSGNMKQQREQILASCQQAGKRLEAKLRQRLESIREEERKDEQWDVTEKENEVQPHIYELTKLMSNTVFEQANVRGRRVKTIKWNPVREIKRYGKEGDPFLHTTNHPFTLYDKAIAKLGYIIPSFFTSEEMGFVEKGRVTVSRIY